MEVGAVKQAFNNELILLKKNLNQARIQIIHNLTRKAKKLAENKAQGPVKEKLKRKAESAVKEVLIIKKIKPRDLGKFIVTHKGQLQEILNRPQVDNEKACARLLLHKALQEKYKLIRNRFADVPIKDLFMSRQERRKLKKEAREMQKTKKKNKGKVINAEGNWDVEDIENNDNSKNLSHSDDENILDKLSKSDDEDSDNSDAKSDDELYNSDVDESPEKSDDHVVKVRNKDSEMVINIRKKKNHSETESEDELHNSDVDESPEKNNDHEVEVENKDSEMVLNVVKKKKIKHDNSTIPAKTIIENKMKMIEQEIKKKQEKNAEKKQKDSNKNRNFNDKILQRKFKKVENDAPALENKVVDPFFITSTGENYMSVAEPRQPDEIKEIHKQGNRQQRRAAMFGHAPKVKPKRNTFEFENNKFNKHNSFNDSFNNRIEKEGGFQNKFNKNGNYVNDKNNFKDRGQKRSNEDESKPEKLHPSWEAKKRQSGILPFQGKKIVFDEN